MDQEQLTRQWAGQTRDRLDGERAESPGVGRPSLGKWRKVFGKNDVYIQVKTP